MKTKKRYNPGVRKLVCEISAFFASRPLWLSGMSVNEFFNRNENLAPKRLGRYAELLKSGCDYKKAVRTMVREITHGNT